MKKYIFVLMVVALFFTSTAFADINEGDYLYLASYQAARFIPENIHTGDSVSMTVDIKNRGTKLGLTDLNAELILDNSFEGINTTYFVDKIEKGITEKLIFDFKVGENTLPGNYFSTLNMTYLREGKEVFQQQEIIITVTKTDKKVDITVSPSVVSPGSKENLVFKITNLTNQPISNISFVWEEENNLVLPLGSDNKRFISYLDAKESATITYLVAADPNILTGIYPLTATTTMNDNNGTLSQTSTIGLIVGGSTDFDISTDVSDTLLSINIANIGTNNAESVIVSVSGQGISIKNNKEIIGNLDRGDYTVASFETNSMNAKEAQVEISYTDTTGERQSVTKTISLGNMVDQNFGRTMPDGTTFPSGNASNFRGRVNQQQAFPMNELIILIILIVVGVVCYKKRNTIRGKIKKLRK